jgi:flagellar protein FliS
MSYRNNPWQSYRQVVTQTASPGQLVLMMYDGAIRFLERALVGFANEDPAEFNQVINNNVLRAQEIINELNGSLNMRDGGDFAANMRRLYNYMDWRLQQSNNLKQEAGIREAIGRLTVLRDAWSQMLQQQAQASHTGIEEGVLVAQA